MRTFILLPLLLAIGCTCSTPSISQPVASVNANIDEDDEHWDWGDEKDSDLPNDDDRTPEDDYEELVEVEGEVDIDPVDEWENELNE